MNDACAVFVVWGQRTKGSSKPALAATVAMCPYVAIGATAPGGLATAPPSGPTKNVVIGHGLRTATLPPTQGREIGSGALVPSVPLILRMMCHGKRTVPDPCLQTHARAPCAHRRA